MDDFKVLGVKRSMFENNDADAVLLRGQLVPKLRDKLHIGVMEADIDSAIDERTTGASGAKVIRLNTGGICHFDADMTRQEWRCEVISALAGWLLEKIGKWRIGENE